MDLESTSGLGTVRDWMTARPVTVGPEVPIEGVAQLMRERGIRHVLVMDGDRLTGIVSNRDLRRPLTAPVLSPNAPVRHVMTEAPIVVGPDLPLPEAARLLLERKIGALPVIEGERVTGILTKSDALEALLMWVERVAPPSR